MRLEIRDKGSITDYYDEFIEKGNPLTPEVCIHIGKLVKRGIGFDGNLRANQAILIEAHAHAVANGGMKPQPALYWTDGVLSPELSKAKTMDCLNLWAESVRSSRDTRPLRANVTTFHLETEADIRYFISFVHTFNRMDDGPGPFDNTMGAIDDEEGH